MMRWRGDAQKTEAPRHNQPPCATELGAVPRNSLRAGALDVRLREPTRGRDNRCHHVVTMGSASKGDRPSFQLNSLPPMKSFEERALPALQSQIHQATGLQSPSGQARAFAHASGRDLPA